MRKFKSWQIGGQSPSISSNLMLYKIKTPDQWRRKTIYSFINYEFQNILKRQSQWWFKEPEKYKQEDSKVLQK